MLLDNNLAPKCLLGAAAFGVYGKVASKRKEDTQQRAAMISKAPKKKGQAISPSFSCLQGELLFSQVSLWGEHPPFHKGEQGRRTESGTALSVHLLMLSDVSESRIGICRRHTQASPIVALSTALFLISSILISA